MNSAERQRTNDSGCVEIFYKYLFRFFLYIILIFSNVKLYKCSFELSSFHSKWHFYANAYNVRNVISFANWSKNASMRLCFFSICSMNSVSHSRVKSFRVYFTPPHTHYAHTIKKRVLEYSTWVNVGWLVACQHERDNLIGSIFNEKYVVTRMLLKWHIKLLITLLFRIRIIICCIAHICILHRRACVCVRVCLLCMKHCTHVLSYADIFGFRVFRFVDASEHLRNSLGTTFPSVWQRWSPVQQSHHSCLYY